MSTDTDKRLICPTCRISFLLSETTVPPFCCERCQLIDLGQWLNEEHGLPFEGDPGDSPVKYRGDPEEE